MNKKNNLSILVKSLNANEKRFFKLYAKLHNNNKTPQYVYVFNLLDKNELLSNDQINTEISKVIPAKSISRTKQYLKHHIFEALRAYHKKGSEKLQENEDINIAEILLKKKLYPMAKKILLKLRKNAIETENFDLHFRNSSDRLEENLYDRVTQILEKDLSVFNKNKFLSNKSELSYYQLVHTIYFWLNKKEDYIKSTGQLKQIVERSFFQHFPQTIVFTSVNILKSYVDHNLIEPFYSVLNKAQSIIDKYVDLKIMYQHWIYMRELELYSYVIAKDIDQKVIDKIMNHINKPENEVSTDKKNMLLVSLAVCYFLNERYENCQDTMLKITLENNISVNSNYFLEAYLIEVLCYFELNENNIAKQKWNVLQRKIKKSNIKNAELSSIINSLNSILKSKKINLQNLKTLNDLLEIKENKVPLIFKDDLYFLPIWVKKKIKTIDV